MTNLPPTSLNPDAYQELILQDVSRTFALTIPQLPKVLERVVGNAYLLCRIADTIEDDKHLSPQDKRHFSEEFIRVVQGKQDPNYFAKQLAPRLSVTATMAERDLIVNTPTVIELTHQFNERQRVALEHCVTVMANGMSHYQEQETLNGLKDIASMGDYCYHVAGVVGEMLTELFCAYSETVDKQHQYMMPLAVSFGQFLQMTNILKDIWEDHQRGACWLPRDIFEQHGVTLSKKTVDNISVGFQKGLKELVGIAYAHGQNALKYILLIPANEKGLRRFCLSALGMAVLTLDEIYHCPNFTQGKQVKISRNQVKITLLLTHLFASHDNALKFLFNFAGRNLPTKHINEILVGS